MNKAKRKRTMTKTKSRSPSRPKKKSANASKRTPLVNLKVTPRIHTALYGNARKFAKGNLSAWLRFSGLAFKPTKAQVQQFFKQAS